MKTITQYITEYLVKGKFVSTSIIDTNENSKGKITGEQRLFVETLIKYICFGKEFENESLFNKVKLTPKMIVDKYEIPTFDGEEFHEWYYELPNSFLENIFDEYGYAEEDLDYCGGIIEDSSALVRALYSNMLKDKNSPFYGEYVIYDEKTGKYSDLDIA